MSTLTALEKETQNFFKKFPTQVFRKKGIVIGKNHTVESIHYLEKGFVQMFTHDTDGKKILLHVFKPGSFFPLVPKLSTWASHRQYVFEAMTPISVRTAPAKETIDFLKANPDILFRTLERLTDALVGSMERFKQMNVDTNRRIVSLMMYLIQSFGKKIGNTASIDINLTHQDIAAWIGVSRESVSRFLSQLKQEKIIQLQRGGLKINSLSKLTERAKK